MPHTPNLTRGATRLVAITLFVALLSAAVVPLFEVAAAPLAATSPTLGAAGSYSVLGGETVTNTGPTTMPGDLGVSPGSAVTGSPTVGPPGTIHAADQSAADAQVDNTAVFGFLDQACNTTYAGVKDLVGENLVPGVYCADAFTLSGTLTLSGSGVWIFKSASTLITSGTANVVGDDPCNVWWRVVSSATLGTNTSLIGNILASTSISLQTGASLNGRALAQTGSVTLDSNTITGLACLTAPAATSTPTATATPTSTATSTPTNTSVPAPTNTQVPAPTNTPLPAPTNTPLPAPTVTPLPAPTVTATTPPVVGLPPTGGAPLRGEDFPWTVVLVASVVGAMALGLSVRARRRARQARR